MYLPALPVIAVDLHGTAGDIQLTLSSFMIAFGSGQIFYGPAGDRFGRRPVILGGIAIYVLASIGCAFADGSGPARGAALPAGPGGLRRRGAGAHHGARSRRARPGGARHVADDGLHLDRAHAGAADRRADPVVPGLARDLLGAGRNRRGGARRRLPPPARDPAAGIPPAAGAVLDPEALRRAVPPSRLHGLRLHQHVHVLGAAVVPVGLALRVHRALRHRAARTTA